MNGFNNKTEANTVWYVNMHSVEVPVKPDVPSALSMQLTELKNNAAEFFTAAKCSISNVANKFGDWVKRVFICTDFRSSDAGKPADSLLPEKTESPEQQLAKLLEFAQPGLIKTYNQKLINQVDVLNEKIKGETQINKSELTDISTNKDLGLRHIVTALEGISKFKGLDLLSKNAGDINKITLKFEGLEKEVEFRQLGSVNSKSLIMGAVNNENFTKEFKSKITKIFSQIRENIIPQLASAASGSSGNIG
ncbi:hypothetical protein Q4R42_04275 [Morganella morganii subsp. sibonii]|uniref:hypothetical protein n=1 Tax=Morganella morganii TaxID=582 RepID=UPI001BD43993|nr:hypothetical protein [Morganella morganii]MBS9540781.1 hypothetical protein [Morganella morganii subsp. morganii]